MKKRIKVLSGFLTLCLLCLLSINAWSQVAPGTLSGIIALDQPIDNADITIKDFDGNILLNKENATFSKGAFVISLENLKLPDKFTFIANADYDGEQVELSNSFVGFDYLNDSVFINAVTTLITRYAQDRSISYEQSANIVCDKLQIPFSVDPAYDITINNFPSIFSPSAFMKQARENGGFNNYIDALVQQISKNLPQLGFQNNKSIQFTSNSRVSPQGFIEDIDWGELLKGAAKGLALNTAGFLWGKFLDSVLDDPYTPKAQYLDLRKKLVQLSNQLFQFQQEMKLDLKINNYDNRVSILDSHYLSAMANIEQKYDILFSLQEGGGSASQREAIRLQAQSIQASLVTNREKLREGILAINAALIGKNGISPLIQDTWSEIIDGKSDFQDDHYNMKLHQYYEFKAMQISMLNFVMEDMNSKIGTPGSTDTEASTTAYYNLIMKMLDEQDNFIPAKNITSQDSVYHGLNGLFQVSEKLRWYHYVSNYPVEREEYISGSYGGTFISWVEWLDYTKDGHNGQHMHVIGGYKLASLNQMKTLLKSCPPGMSGTEFLQRKGFSQLPAIGETNFHDRYVVKTSTSRAAYDISHCGEYTWSWFCGESPERNWNHPTVQHYFLVLDVSEKNEIPSNNTEKLVVTNQLVTEAFSHLPDNNSNGIADAWEEINGIPEPVDSDNDGLPDAYTLLYPDVNDDPDADFDNDGLPNLKEYELKTNPFFADTDADSIIDGWEVSYDLDPLNPGDASEDFDGDGYKNSEEFELDDGDPWKKRIPAGWNSVSVLKKVKEFNISSRYDNGPYRYDPQENDYVAEHLTMLPGQGYLIFNSKEKFFDVRTAMVEDTDSDEEVPDTGIPAFQLFE